METTHGARTCRWAVPTLFLPPPIWMGAWDAPWVCLQNAQPRLLDSTEVCAACPRWEPLAGSAADAQSHSDDFDSGR